MLESISASNSLCHDLVLHALIIIFFLNLQAIIRALIRDAAPYVILYLCGTVERYKSLKAVEAFIEEHWKTKQIYYFSAISQSLSTRYESACSA